MTRCNFLVAYITGLSWLFASTMAYGEVEDPKSLSTVYIGGSLNSTFPTGIGETYYSRGGTSFTFHYRYVMPEDWLVGTSAGFKAFQDLDHNDAPFFAIEQKTTKLFRIYYPAWLGVGISGLYLVGVEKINFPYQRNRDIQPQFGFGYHGMLVYKFSTQWLGIFEINHWRSTQEQQTLVNRVHVIEGSLGLNIALDSI